MQQENIKTGSCLCGEVAYELSGTLTPITGCHCIQCRKTTGHFLASTNTQLEDFTLTTQTGLKWYRSSGFASRGFCTTCGATLFWQRDGSDRIAISAGTINGETDLTISHHIFCEFAGDYYDIEENELNK